MHIPCILNIKCTYAFMCYTLLIQLYNSICKDMPLVYVSYRIPIGICYICYIVCIHRWYTYTQAYTLARTHAHTTYL